jgi:hypothetical protein
MLVFNDIKVLVVMKILLMKTLLRTIIGIGKKQRKREQLYKH